MKIQNLLIQLIESGVRESRVADLVRAQGVDCTQATINRIKNGVIQRPRYELGAAIVSVCRTHNIPIDPKTAA